jgi:predicted O-methyltransferase YrrM
VRPFSFHHTLDPFSIKTLSKASPLRIVWTAESRLLESLARARFRASPLPFGPGAVVTMKERGDVRQDTAVTVNQLALLQLMVDRLADIDGHVAEIGSYRGVTTLDLAARTTKTVCAIDPFVGYGGHEEDYQRFRSRTGGAANIVHLREPSGAASSKFAPDSLSMVFIDAIHDVSNSWYDFVVWSGKVRPGGLIALHDVDDHPGVRFTAQRVTAKTARYSVWGYCPNLLVLQKR